MMRLMGRLLKSTLGWGAIIAAIGGLSPYHLGAATPSDSEIPADFDRAESSFDHVRREEMIPMRDGVKLHTVILVPKNAARAPILLTRTPYNADELTQHTQSGHLAAVLQGYDNATDVIVDGGYIRVIQDVRGKYKSEGDYVMNRPLRGPLNASATDHSTDTWDTIDWLVKNIPESNGKVGILGISYDGFTPLMALIHPHPALKVAVPMNPMVDGWMGDDWFHNGAFRQQNLLYIYEQEATKANDEKWWSSVHDDYDLFMRAVSAGELGRQHGMEQLGFWNKLIAHPAYDDFWAPQAMDKILAREPLSVPILLVHSLWDAEDIYGDIAVYQALKPKDRNNDKVFLAMGPWNHGGEIDDGSSLGPIKFDGDTSRQFRRDVLAPFLARYLKDGAPKAEISPVTAYETGTNRWRHLASWPSGCESGCTIKPTPIYLAGDFGLSWTRPAAAASDEYVSDPAKPVPYRARPSQPAGYDPGMTWSQWLVDDQREDSGRTDVLTYTGEVLTAPVKIAGQPKVDLHASTTGTDGDFVVKLIDVYPDEVPEQKELGGYQLMIAADIFRGRYRESLSVPHPLTPNQPLAYSFNLPTTNHVFLPGHRIMVQVQSAWFPLYDRNPQTFVPNIFWAKPADYRKATIGIFRGGADASAIELPVVTTK